MIKELKLLKLHELIANTIDLPFQIIFSSKTLNIYVNCTWKDFDYRLSIAKNGKIYSVYCKKENLSKAQLLFDGLTKNLLGGIQ